MKLAQKKKRCFKTSSRKLRVRFLLALVILMDSIYTGNTPTLDPKLRFVAAGFNDDGVGFIFHSHDTAADAANLSLIHI